MNGEYWWVTQTTNGYTIHLKDDRNLRVAYIILKKEWEELNNKQAELEEIIEYMRS